MIHIVAPLLFALLLAAPNPCLGQRWDDSTRGPRYLVDIAETPGLDLTQEQERRIAELRELHWREILVLRQELREKGRELRGLWLAPTPDHAKIGTLQGEVQAIQGRLQERLSAYSSSVYEVLTSAQREKIKDLPWLRRGMGRMGPARHGAPGRGSRPEKAWHPEPRN